MMVAFPTSTCSALLEEGKAESLEKIADGYEGVTFDAYTRMNDDSSFLGFCIIILFFTRGLLVPCFL